MTAPTTTFDPEYALPNAAYREPAFLDAEMAGIWHTDWVFVTTEDHVSSPGDRLPVVVGNQPVLLLRNQAGELSAVSNLCAHRGTLLVERPGNAKRIQCPYHAWTYNDGGRLLAAPFTPPGTVDKAAHCLPVYRVESWHGLVFVNLNPDVEPLSQRFAAVEPYVVAQGAERMRHSSSYQETDVWDCNWKLAIINAMESYHLFQVHPKTLEPYTPTSGAYYVAGSARATATGGRVEGADDYLLVSLPPNFVGAFNSGAFYWQAVHPLGPHRCTVRTGGASVGSTGTHSGGTRSSGTRSGGRLSRWLTRASDRVAAYSLPDFLPEDKAICERGQRGVAGDFSPGRLVDAERVVSDFGHYLNWRLNGVEPPAVHVEASAVNTEVHS